MVDDDCSFVIGGGDWNFTIDNNVDRRRNRPSLVQSRIGRIYISDNLKYNCEKADIIPGICSDHSAPYVTFKRLNDESKGRNYWKMNNTLLEDNEFVGLMCNKITEFVQMSQQLTSERSKWKYIKYKNGFSNNPKSKQEIDKKQLNNWKLKLNT